MQIRQATVEKPVNKELKNFWKSIQYLFVTGLREGTMFKLENRNLTLIGDRNCRIFKKGKAPVELSAKDDFNFLLK
jgi:hypothetical protein